MLPTLKMPTKAVTALYAHHEEVHDGLLPGLQHESFKICSYRTEVVNA